MGRIESIRNRFTVLVGLFLVLFLPVVVADSPGFSNDTMLTNSTFGTRLNPSVATDSLGNSHIVYNSGTSGRIFYQKLNINGIVVVSELQKTFFLNDSRRPDVAVDGSDNLFIVWEENRVDNDHDIFLRKLDNSGQNLSADIQVSNAARESINPAVVVDSQGSVHVVWSDQRNFLSPPISQQFDLYYAKVLSNGTVTVSETALTSYLSGTAEGARYPSIAIDSHDDVHVVFSKSETSSSRTGHYMKLNNSGGVLVSPINVTLGPLGESGSPSLGLDSNDLVHVAFVGNEGGSNTEIWYARLFNNGSSTNAARRLTFDGNVSDVVDGAGPSLAVDDVGNSHIAWMDDRYGNLEIFYTEIDNVGNTIIDDRQLTFANVSALLPSLVLDSRGPVVTWHDFRNNPSNLAEIFYKRSIPFLNITDFSVVYSNQSDRLFRFGVHNIAGQNLTSINWRLNTGETLINSTLQANLTINEKLMVFVWYSYINSGNYTVYATGLNQDVSATKKLQVLV